MRIEKEQNLCRSIEIDEHQFNGFCLGVLVCLYYMLKAILLFWPCCKDISIGFLYCSADDHDLNSIIQSTDELRALRHKL